MKFASLWGASSPAAISTASCSNQAGLLEKNSLLKCDSVSDERVTGERLLALVEISEEGVYVAMAAVVVAVVVVGAAVVGESKVVAAVLVARDASKSIAFLRIAAMSLIDVNITLVVGRWLWLRWWYWVQLSVCRRR